MSKPPAAERAVAARLSGRVHPGTAAAARPRTKPAAVRRDELLNAAERLFLQHGITATSIDQIVAAADVAKGTFYLHFPSKEQLLIALQQRYVAQHAQRLRTATEGRRAADWTGRLNTWIRAGIDFYLDHLALHDLVFHEFRPEQDTATHENLAVAQLTELLQSGRRAGAWTMESEPLTATMLFHALHGLLDQSVNAGGRINRKQLAHQAGEFFRRALGLR
jgi:AcrR family transcriptional regulator